MNLLRTGLSADGVGGRRARAEGRQNNHFATTQHGGEHSLATQQGAEEIAQHMQGHGVEAHAEADATGLGTDGMVGNRAET